jgi:DNA repair protein RadC
MQGRMEKLSFEVEGWPGEALIAAVLASGPIEGRHADVSSELASSLLSDLGGLPGLSRATLNEIEAGLSDGRRNVRAVRASARRLAAAFELGRRAAAQAAAPASVKSSADVMAWAATRLSRLDHEELWLLALDGRSRLLAVRCVARGGLHGLSVGASEPLRIALRATATAFVLVHNHPSGDPTPSVEDVAFTRRVAAAAAIVGTPLVDHVVVTRDGFASVPFDADAGALASGATDA